MKSNPFQGVIIGVVAGSIMWLSGCAIYDAAIVGLHDSLDEMKQGDTAKPPATTTTAATKPAPTGALVVPLAYIGDEEAWMRSYVAIRDAADKALTNSTPATTKPAPTGALAVPLSYLGDEATVDALLAAGKYPESDNRTPYKFQLLRPDGKSWSFANFVEAGLVRDGRVYSGLFHDQHYTPVYQSEHDQGTMMPGHALKDGDTLGAERFIYFECRNKQ
jgi:hypothetical protein